MPLPDILMPSTLPAWSAVTHDRSEATQYAHVPMSTGHSRTRRIYTSAEINQLAQLELSHEQFQIFHDWFENTLQAGLLRFSALFQGFSRYLVWYDAQLVDYELRRELNGNQVIVQANLILRGNAEELGPELLSASDLSTVILTSSAQLVISASASDLTQVNLIAEVGGSVADLSIISLDAFINNGPPEDDLLRVWMGLDVYQGSYEDNEAHLAHLMGL